MTVPATSRPGSGLAPGDDVGAFFVDVHFQPVDAVVVGFNFFCEFGVAFDQGADGFAELLFDDAAHLHDLVADVLQFFVELLGNVVTKVQIAHASALSQP